MLYAREDTSSKRLLDVNPGTGAENFSIKINLCLKTAYISFI